MPTYGALTSSVATVAIWRGHHVVEPTELTEQETSIYWRELLALPFFPDPEPPSRPKERLTEDVIALRTSIAADGGTP
jgi:hypothetical protein